MTEATSGWLAFAEPAFNTIAILLAFGSILGFLFGALQSVRKTKIGDADDAISSERLAFELQTIREPETPFETTALANYYNQVLSRANISFWFSLLFAAIGFGVIIFAFVTHNPTDTTGTIIKVGSGVVIDGVSSLFFVQSTAAQKSMSEFFEKLRLDRLNVEARGMINDIEDTAQRDRLRAQLILKYSGIDKLLTDIAGQSAADGDG